MSKNDEVRVALDAFNRVRNEVGGVKTDEQQRYAMNEALDAVDRLRSELKRQNCQHFNKRGNGMLASDGSSSWYWYCPDCGASGRGETPPMTAQRPMFPL